MAEMVIVTEPVGRWNLLAATFVQSEGSLAVPVVGIVGNSVPTTSVGRQRLLAWKHNVASQTKQHRGMTPWNPRWIYAISIGFSFYPPAHGNQRLDVENFIKPTIDALAAGLMCANDQEPALITRYNFDDSNFSYLFIHRLPDAQCEEEEGAGIYGSVLK